MFISFRSFNHDYHSQDYLEAVSFYIIVFNDGVLTVSYIKFRLTSFPFPLKAIFYFSSDSKTCLILITSDVEFTN